MSDKNFLKRILGMYPNDEEQQILNRIEASGYKTLKVRGRGTVSLDPKEMTESIKFKNVSERARKLVRKSAA